MTDDRTGEAAAEEPDRTDATDAEDAPASHDGHRPVRRGRVAAAFSALSGNAPPRPPLLHVATATLAVTITLAVIGAAADATDLALLIPPMAATVALIVGAPDLPLAQPRNVIVGHLVGGAVGTAAAAWFGPSVLVGGVAAGLTFGLMLLLRSAHSPGAATAMLLVVLPTGDPWRFMAVLVASSALVVVAGLAANRIRRLRYPAYWW
ncbi:HPP family protein [uncultured Corynebacterium sp.]|uniref:HPP family protein n=1 Tax=uncultured Corynebacterium sp. TaxID=159447 RepID=UPI0026012E94|nr:HPP family protein [uncultured Corynebacterium sp.]